MGFETYRRALSSARGICVNLPRWGLKHGLRDSVSSVGDSVNLPRWGLKRGYLNSLSPPKSSVNLPRWGLKLGCLGLCLRLVVGCKFTPLGFET